jgi:hypothetical protein
VEHHSILAGQPFALLGADRASLGAGCTGRRVKGRLADHEVRGRGAGLGAITKRRLMLPARVLAAHLQAM